MLTGDSGKYKARSNLWVCDFPSSSFQDHFTVPIPVGLKYVPPIVTTPEMFTSCNFLTNTLLSLQMRVFDELSTIAVLLLGSKVLDRIESFETLQITAKSRL